jgi:hypothetical protein
MESPHERDMRESRAARKHAEESARRVEHDRLLNAYTKLKERERSLERTVNAMCLTSDIQQLIAADGELNMIRRVLATSPEEIAAAYQPPMSPAQLQAQSESYRRAEVAGGLAREADYIERHELPALEAKLNEIPTARELGAWAGFDDPRERHFQFIREQIAAKRARVAECRKGAPV